MRSRSVRRLKTGKTSQLANAESFPLLPQIRTNKEAQQTWVGQHKTKHSMQMVNLFGKALEM